MPEPLIADRNELARWVAANTRHELFWEAAPSWSAGVAREQLGSELAIWTDQALFTVGVWAAAIAIHFDGVVTLKELAEDVSAGVDISLDSARNIVAAIAVELASLGAIKGLELVNPSDTDPSDSSEEPEESEESEESEAPYHQLSGPNGEPFGESSRIDDETGEEIRVVTALDDQGNVVTTEHLPDGRRRISTVWISGNHRDRNTTEALEILGGDRSPAELVPSNSCLGSKLRDSEHVPLLSFRCRDGRIRSVRCHAPEIADALCRVAGDSLVASGERGPVVAFAVTPLEGSGPVRIYDGYGRRRGRPRSVSDAVAIIDQILGECTDEAAPIDARSPVPIDLVLVHRSDTAVLVPMDIANARGVARRLRAAGWTTTWGRATLRVDLSVASPTEFSDPATVPSISITALSVPTFEDRDLSPADLITLLVLGTADEADDRSALLTRASQFALRVATPHVKDLLPGLLHNA